MNKAGWFVSQESCEVFMQGMAAAQAMSGGAPAASAQTSSYSAGPQQMKRAYDYGGADDGDWYGKSGSYGKSDYSYGKDGKGQSYTQKGFGGKGGPSAGNFGYSGSKDV